VKLKIGILCGAEKGEKERRERGYVYPVG